MRNPMEDKIKKYENILIDFLQTQASYRVANSQLENQLIIDKENHHTLEDSLTIVSATLW